MSDTHAGTPLLSRYINGGAQMMAKKPESKKVTINEFAARIPATTMINAASTKITRDALEKPRELSMSIPIAKTYDEGATIAVTKVLRYSG